MNRREAIGVALAATVGVATSKPCDLCADPLCDGLFRCGYCFPMPRDERPVFAGISAWSDHCVAVHGSDPFTVADVRRGYSGKAPSAEALARLKSLGIVR